MKKFFFNPSILQAVYLIICLILFSLIILTPSLINGPIHLTKKLIIEEQLIEGILLFVLFIMSLIILYLYKNEVVRQKDLIKKIDGDKKVVEEKLTRSSHYIGKVNVQIQEIKFLFNSNNGFPETRNDFKKSFRALTNRVLGIVNTEWVLMRIINSNTQKTLGECRENRSNNSFNHPLVSNKMIIEKHNITHSTLLISNPENLNVLVCCVMPVENISNDQKIFVQAIANEIMKLFVIYNSLFSKNGKRIVINSHSNDYSP